MAVRTVLQHADITRALTRISHEILESNRGAENLVVVGIPTRGVVLAHRIAGLMSTFSGLSVPAGALDVTLYRDDLAQNPIRSLSPTQLPANEIEGATVILVDDVLYSGRTIRAALDALSALGRPQAVRLAVLIDRGHRELPIRPDFVGKNLPSSTVERVNVRLEDIDDAEEVTIHA
jgi:pyrimidine operon attenuation protein/uracil phosphoribosyltransferase